MNPEEQKAFLIRFCYIAVILLLALLGIRILFYWLLPFAAGLAVAVLLRPIIRKLSRAALLPRRHAAVMVTSLMYLAILALLWLLAVNSAGFLAGALSSAAQSLPDFVENQLLPSFQALRRITQDLLSRLSPSLAGKAVDFSETIAEQLSNLSAAAMAWAGRLVKSVPSVLFTLTLSVLSSFFIAMDYPRVTAFVLAQIPPRWQQLLFACRRFLTGQLLRVLRGYLIIMGITFCELATGFWLLKIPAFLQRAALIAILDILPLIGTGGILIPWTVLELVQGNRFLALGLLILYGIVTVVRTITEPKIIGDQTGLPPLVTLTAMYVGWKLGGFAGIIGAPLAVMLLCWLQETGVLRLWKTPVSQPEETKKPPKKGG